MELKSHRYGSLTRRVASALCAGAFALALVSSPARADTLVEPTAVVHELVSGALALLGNHEITTEARERKFRVLLERNFDMPRITHFVLNRYWNRASDEERNAFGDLFEEWIVRIYARGFTDFRGETVKVTGYRLSRENYIIVSTEIDHPQGGTPDRVDWMLRRDGNGFKILDVEVSGISLVMTARDEILSTIDQSGGTVSGVNNALKQMLASES